MAIRFHLDENVSGAVALSLRQRGVDITTPVDAGLIGADDTEQLRFAHSGGRVLVTHDDDFTRVHANGAAHSGICYCHQDKYSTGDLIRLLVVVSECLTEIEMRGHLEYL
jgi:predicted nuclease of predicted toxin-antitoxin system